MGMVLRGIEIEIRGKKKVNRMQKRGCGRLR